MKIIINEPQQTAVSSKTGNAYTYIDLYVETSASIYPEKVRVFQECQLSRGIYKCPVIPSVRNGRLEFQFDFFNAQKIEK